MQAVGVQGVIRVVHVHRTSEHQQRRLGLVLTVLKLNRPAVVLQSPAQRQQGHFPLQMVAQNRTRQLPGLCVQLNAAVRIGFGPHPLGLWVQLHFIGPQGLRTIRQLHIAHGPEGSIVIPPGAIAPQTAVLHAQEHPANQPLHIGLRTVPKDGVRLQNLDANGFAFLGRCDHGDSSGKA